MKPYFERGDIQIFHGDALEILPGLKADALITDPPYSEHVHTSAVREARKSLGEKRQDYDFGFAHLTEKTMLAICAWAANHVNRWSLIFSDIESTHLWRAA